MFFFERSLTATGKSKIGASSGLPSLPSSGSVAFFGVSSPGSSSFSSLSFASSPFSTNEWTAACRRAAENVPLRHHWYMLLNLPNRGLLKQGQCNMQFWLTSFLHRFLRKPPFNQVEECAEKATLHTKPGPRKKKSKDSALEPRAAWHLRSYEALSAGFCGGDRIHSMMMKLEEHLQDKVRKFCWQAVHMRNLVFQETLVWFPPSPNVEGEVMFKRLMFEPNRPSD